VPPLTRREFIDRTGAPAVSGQPAWPADTLPARATLRIDSTCEVVYDRYKEEREMWEFLG